MDIRGAEPLNEWDLDQQEMGRKESIKDKSIAPSKKINSSAKLGELVHLGKNVYRIVYSGKGCLVLEQGETGNPYIKNNNPNIINGR